MSASKKQASKKNKPQNSKKSHQKKTKKSNKTITAPLKTKSKKELKKKEFSVKLLWSKPIRFVQNTFSPLIIFVQALIIISLLALLGILYQLLVVFQFPESVLQSLPANNTVFAFEIAQKLPQSQKDYLVAQIPRETLSYILYFEDQILDQSYAQALRLVKPETKVYAQMQLDKTKEDLFVFSFTEESKLQFLQIFKPFNLDWKAVFINNNMYVSQSDDLLNLLKNDYPPLTTSESFQDAYYNIPKQNFATAYCNMSLLNPNNNQVFGTSIATFRPSPEGMYLATYTNSSQPETKFYATQNKYQAKLLEHLPSNPNYVFAGLELSQRLQYFLKQNGYQSSQLKNYFMARNLGSSSLQFIQKVLENEIALATYEDGQYLLLSETPENPAEVLEQIAHYQAYLNATPESHTLESGVVAKNLVPDYSFKYQKTAENTYVFPINSSPETAPSELILYQQASRYYLSNSADLIQRVKSETKTFSTNLDTKPLHEMLALADEFFYASPKSLENLLANTFPDFQPPKQIKYPKVQSVGNYFLDGIQTVHLLKW